MSERTRPRPASGPDPSAWGVATGFEDVNHRWREAPSASVQAVLAAMGANWPAPGPAPVVTVRLDRPPRAVPSGQLTLEDGTTWRVERNLPVDLPPGYHRLAPDEALPPWPSSPARGAVRCPPSPNGALPSSSTPPAPGQSWGFGDFGDLQRLGRWSGPLGAGLRARQPAARHQPGAAPAASPYFPGSRCFLNPLYLAVENVRGGSDAAGPGDAGGRREGAQPGSPHRPRPGLGSSSRRRSRRSTGASAAIPASTPTWSNGVRSSPGFATFCALAERHGGDWRRGRPPCSIPGRPPCATSPDHPPGPCGCGTTPGCSGCWTGNWPRPAITCRRVRPGDRRGPGGPDAWMWQDVFVRGMRVGAPPDRFNTRGQDWALPPFDPWRLRTAGYEPWIESLRGALRHGGGLRLDHVMGLFRLFWIPEGATPAEGAYVRYPHDDLLNVVALEAHRAGAYVSARISARSNRQVRRELSGSGRAVVPGVVVRGQRPGAMAGPGPGCGNHSRPADRGGGAAGLGPGGAAPARAGPQRGGGSRAAGQAPERGPARDRDASSRR